MLLQLNPMPLVPAEFVHIDLPHIYQLMHNFFSLQTLNVTNPDVKYIAREQKCTTLNGTTLFLRVRVIGRD